MTAETPLHTYSEHDLDLALALPARPRLDHLQARFAQLRRHADALIASLGDDGSAALSHQDAAYHAAAPAQRTGAAATGTARTGLTFNAGADAEFKARAEAQLKREADLRLQAKAALRKQA